MMFGMCAEDIAVKATEFVSEKSVQVLTSVDISDPHLMQFIVSREYQNSLPPAVREAFACSVEAQFGNCKLLEEQLILMIEEQGEKPLALTTRGTTSSQPNIHSAPASVLTESDWENKFEKACARFKVDELTFSQAAKVIVGVTKRSDQYSTLMETFSAEDMDQNGVVDMEEFLLVVHQLGLL
mmetsp:Transcript_17834/g.45241  ORF Transcript_17834/g.45241 Transcript_17834/m.45241 type:complete len:183 (+) Transcript_17834:636-1184(+)